MNLSRAIEIAVAAHRGQKDKSGVDYILHPLRVMSQGRTETEKICGVLHDVVEDTEWTLEGLEREGFSREVIAVLR
ncbi:MAG: phosphohydrolase, partial [Prevotellaceae bacterium]|nr:phosphohydrolase [Prevotellaceae bacterium]